jgi:hypothetical protein
MTAARLVPLSEAAHLLSLSWGQAWRLVLQGRLGGEKVDGRWMVRIDDIDRWGRPGGVTRPRRSRGSPSHS